MKRASLLLFLAASMISGGGSTFARNPVVTAIPNAAQPQLVEGSDGRVWVVYGRANETPVAPVSGHEHHANGAADPKPKSRPAQNRSGDVVVAVSKDGGLTFAPGVRAAHVPKIMLGLRRGPRIAAHGDKVTVTLVADELIAFSSSDGGQTWSGPVTINDVPTSAREGLQDLAGSKEGALFVTWLDLRNGGTELWGASSNDGGRTWGKNEQVYRSPDKSVCECCHPSALFDAQGNLAVMWRNSIEGARDMWMTTRARGTKEFARAKKIGEGTWNLKACPMDGGKMVALGYGKFGSVWQRNGEVFFAADQGAEILLGKGRQPVAIGRGAETLIFWQRDADLVSIRKPGDTPTTITSDARFAAAIPVAGGKGVVIAYEQGPAKEKQPGIVIERL